MRSHLRLPVALTAILLAALACNLPQATPTSDPNVAFTAAAQTVAAQLTQSALTLAAPTATGVVPSPTNTGVPTLPPPTIPPSATTECDRAQFVDDVTIPDGKKMAPGEAFTKTWRLRNIGSCTWAGYSLVFDTGDSMNGPASSAIANTPPGGTVDISVNLTAPAAPGSYRGYWRIRNVSGYLLPVTSGYQGRSFYVDIKVQSPMPPAVAQVTLSNIYGEGGQVRSNGTVLSPPNTGDIESNAAAQAFFSFDMTAIPASATITKVVVDFSSFDTLGNPWTLGDGCVRAYVQNYGTLDAGDFFPGDPTGAMIRWCGAAELGSVFEETGMKSVVQNAVGSSRLQLRVQFRAPTTTNNGIADMIRFGTVKLIVTYQP